jgi:micrococcal nuclease
VSRELFKIWGCLFLIVSLSNSAWAFRDCAWKEFKDKKAQIAGTQDGDTLTLLSSNGVKQNVRLLAIDTPESYFRGHTQGEWAQKARLRLRELLPRGTEVSVQLDRIYCDANNRLLAYIFVNEQNVNQLMVQEGWAVNYCVSPNEFYCKEFGLLAEDNWTQRRGFLGDESIDLPYIFREKKSTGTPFNYFVGDISTKLVYSNKDMEKIPVGQRVFFYNAKNIRPPYRLDSSVSDLSLIQ